MFMSDFPISIVTIFTLQAPQMLWLWHRPTRKRKLRRRKRGRRRTSRRLTRSSPTRCSGRASLASCMAECTEFPAGRLRSRWSTRWGFPPSRRPLSRMKSPSCRTCIIQVGTWCSLDVGQQLIRTDQRQIHIFSGVVNLERMFETSERIFVVMEKLKGGSFFLQLSAFPTKSCLFYVLSKYENTVTG